MYTSFPLDYADLSKDDLQQKWHDVQEVLELHAVDPVAAMEVWKAMHSRHVTSAMSGLSRSTPRTGSRKRGSLPEPRGVIPVEAQAEETILRQHRASHYPERALLLLDPAFNTASIVDVRRTLRQVKDETRRFEAEIKKWRSAIDRDDALPDLAETQNFHALEEELLDAQLEDFQIHLSDAEEIIRRQQIKLDVLTRHASKVLGDQVYDDVPPVQTADDLARLVKSTQLDIRELKFQQDQKRQTQTRVLSRAQKKVALLEEHLEERKAKALEEARRTHPVEEDRREALRHRREKRCVDIALVATEKLIATETESRKIIEDMLANAVKILKSDFQIALLTMPAGKGSASLDASQATFAVPEHALSKGRKRKVQ